MKIKKSLLDEGDALTSWNKLADYYTSLPEEKDYYEMDVTEQVYYLLFSMHYQILNGGVMQFIDNAAGNYFHGTLDASRKIGFEELTEILTKVADVFPDSTVPADWDERRETIDVLNEANLIKGGDFDYTNPEWSQFWEDLDSAYYSNEAKLYKLTIKYLLNNATLID